MGPWAGWMGGWAIIVADVIVMANLAQNAGLYSFLLAIYVIVAIAAQSWWSAQHPGFFRRKPQRADPALLEART